MKPVFLAERPSAYSGLGVTDVTHTRPRMFICLADLVSLYNIQLGYMFQLLDNGVAGKALGDRRIQRGWRLPDSGTCFGIGRSPRIGIHFCPLCAGGEQLQISGSNIPPRAKLLCIKISATLATRIEGPQFSHSTHTQTSKIARFGCA